MLAKFAEDDRIEQMNAHKRRMRQLEHKRAVEKLIEERREQFRQERVRISYNLFHVGYGSLPTWLYWRTVEFLVVIFMIVFSVSFTRKLSWKLDVKKRGCRNTEDKLSRKKDNVCCKNTPRNYSDICQRYGIVSSILSHTMTSINHYIVN